MIAQGTDLNSLQATISGIPAGQSIRMNLSFISHLNPEESANIASYFREYFGGSAVQTGDNSMAVSFTKQGGIGSIPWYHWLFPPLAIWEVSIETMTGFMPWILAGAALLAVAWVAGKYVTRKA